MVVEMFPLLSTPIRVPYLEFPPSKIFSTSHHRYPVTITVGLKDRVLCTPHTLLDWRECPNIHPHQIHPVTVITQRSEVFPLSSSLNSNSYTPENNELSYLKGSGVTFSKPPSLLSDSLYPVESSPPPDLPLPIFLPNRKLVPGLNYQLPLHYPNLDTENLFSLESVTTRISNVEPLNHCPFSQL